MYWFDKERNIIFFCEPPANMLVSHKQSITIYSYIVLVCYVIAESSDRIVHVHKQIEIDPACVMRVFDDSRLYHTVRLWLFNASQANEILEIFCPWVGWRTRLTLPRQNQSEMATEPSYTIGTNPLTHFAISNGCVLRTSICADRRQAKLMT
jgi:hypothetical protein